MKIEGDYVIFSTGKQRSAIFGIIGLSQGMTVNSGYDDSFYAGDDAESWMDESERLSKVELIELADYMIEQWQKFRALHEGIAK